MRKAKVPKLIPVLILFGPTASGKTALAEQLFTGPNALCRAEIVSADSMQVYRGMDIGTAKPDKDLQKRLPHHLIDIRNPDEQFNTGDFVRLADIACTDIYSRNALPLILGGTGFYIKNFIFGLPAAPSSDPALREVLRAELEHKGREVLWEELAALDPLSAEKIHKNDSYRLIRALEICRTSGLPLQALPAEAAGERPVYHFLTVGLHLPREMLYDRINLRCEDMFCRGLHKEVQSLFLQGYNPDHPGLRGIGYREFFVKDTETAKWRLSTDIEGIKALVARNSRRYAKRQETFFKSIPDIVWLSGLDYPAALDHLSSMIYTALDNTT